MLNRLAIELEERIPMQWAKGYLRKTSDRLSGIPWWDEDTERFAILLVFYLSVHFILRLLLADTLQRDEAEQMVLSQSLELGYGTQPPLYSWLVWGVFQLTGPGILGLSIVKYLLLGLTYSTLYFTARLSFRDPQISLLAAFSLLLLPSFSWESLRDLTHSVLATSLSAMTFLVALQLRRRGRLRDYLLFGVLLGLGHLAKYNYALFATALLLAALADRRMRTRLLDLRLLGTIGITLAMIAPYTLWMSQHWESLQGYLVKQTGVGAAGHLEDGLHVLAHLVINIVGFLSPFWLVWLLLFPQTLRPLQNSSGNEGPTLPGNFLLAVGAVLLVLIFGFGFNQFKERWLEPLLFIFPVYLFARLQQAPGNPNRLRFYRHLLFAAALLVVIGRIGQFWGGPVFERYSKLHLPSRDLALKLQAAGFDSGTIISPDRVLAGNMRLHLPGTRVVSVETKAYNPPPRSAAGQCLLVWEIIGEWTGPPAQLRDYFQDHYGKLPDNAVTGQVSAPLFGSTDKFQRLGYLRLANGLGDCH